MWMVWDVSKSVSEQTAWGVGIVDGDVDVDLAM